MTNTPFTVESRHGAYPVNIGREAVQWWKNRLSRAKSIHAPALVCTQSSIFRLHGRPVLAALQSRGYKPVIHHLPQGESSKSFQELTRLYRRLRNIGADRSTPLVAMGGGVVTDLTGYAAATYLRGLDWYALPTSIISQIDSSIGGKVGINFEQAKNQIGSWHPPRAVAASPAWLSTEPRDSYRAGLAELVKIMWVSGFVSPDSLLRDLPLLVTCHISRVTPYLRLAARLKSLVVESDEFERQGLRLILNYGHTVGHAIEAASGYRWRHGTAIGVGMMAAAHLGVITGCTPWSVLKLQADTLTRLGLPTQGLRAWRASVERHLAFDKKRVNDTQRWVLLQGFGKPCIVSNVPSESVRQALERTLSL